ncbi:Rci50p DI49_3246 [Saccharomyces eubayanus]|uniref:Rci50p n=1 Tax=Saccharomyces eubayanus TaxID=1080349 RepID=UPI0006C3A7FF|nr:hypothetical protein DI49_3246 [Saccharomyces eubayanus]KOG98198.1 hypothetical protein DI49_3246 [Saccharomyces eubayanus]
MWKYLPKQAKHGRTIKRLSVLQFVINDRLRLYSTFEEHSIWRTPFRKRSKFQKWTLSIAIVSFVSFNIWWVFWPHHTFPKPVAKILRKGLHAEIEKEGADYRKSLHYYLEALEECKVENVHPLSDEYTGIEIKIGEMYEKLDSLNDAVTLYEGMLKRFYNELSKPTNILPMRKTLLFKRDLQILIRYIEVNKSSEMNISLLIMHLLLAQKYFMDGSPELKEICQKSEIQDHQQLDWRNFKGLPLIGKSKAQYQTYLSSKSKQVLNIKEPENSQNVFVKELLTARELYTQYCLTKNNLTGALNSKITTFEWMLLTDRPLDEVLLAQAELGSIFYLNSEKFEGSVYSISNELHRGPEDKEHTKSKLQSNQEACLQYSADCYKSIIGFAHENQYPQNATDSETDQKILKALSLSHYGLGVINLHKGRLKASKKQLKRAIRISEMIHFNELIKEANCEIKKGSDIVV